MKTTKRTTSTTHHRRFRTATNLGATILALATTAALAAPPEGKGGGKKNDEDPDEPPTVNPPVYYEVTWLTPEEGPDDTRFYDVDSDGVAVGQLRIGGTWSTYDERYGIISFPGRAATNLEELVQLGTHTGDQIPPDWELSAVYTISEGLLVGGDLVDPAGKTHSFAAQLADDGLATTVVSFHIVPTPLNLVRMYLMDASENGEHLAFDLQTLGEDGLADREIVRWSPLNPNASPDPVAPIERALIRTSVNNSGQILWQVAENYNRDSYIDDPIDGLLIVDNDTGFYGAGNDIGEDSTVFGGFLAKRKGDLKPATWTSGDSWQRLGEIPAGNTILAVNSSNQMLGTAGPRYFFYSAATGYFSMDDLVIGTPDDVNRWLLDGSFSITHSFSDPNSTGYGHIAGYVTRDGESRAFVLTPVLP